MTVQKAGVAAALPFLLNPATVGVLAIGAVGWGLFNLLCDDEGENGESAAPVNDEPKVVAKAEEIEAANLPVEDVQGGAQSEPSRQASQEAEARTEASEGVSEAERKEIVRQAMSELGKRSAAARASRKAAASDDL